MKENFKKLKLNEKTMQNFIQILQVLLTWPTAFVFCICVLYKPITLLLKRIVDSNTAKAKLGFIEVELGELTKKGKAAVDNFNDLSMILAKTRMLELEVTKENFAHAFTAKQQVTLNNLMLELNKVMVDLEEGKDESVSSKK